MNQIPMLDLVREYEYMKQDIDLAICQCLRHQHWILGPEVNELEGKLSSYLGVKNCVCVSSGTDALVLSLRALAIKLKGKEYFDINDKIITTPFTFTATGDAILRAGATPVFVDIDSCTFNIDPQKIKECIVSTPNVVGIIPVHLFGQACDLDKIINLAKEYNLFILEDVAQAFWGMWKDKKLGSIGNAAAFSFFPSKNLGCFGDGGMVASGDNEVVDLIKMLLRHGGIDKYNVEHIGYNARLDTFQAAILIAKYKYLDEFNNKRREIAQIYSKGFKNISEITPPLQVDYAHHVYHQYTIRVRGGKRDDLQKYLKEKGIQSMVYYPVLLHKMKVFKGRSANFSSLRNSEETTLEVLSLPIEPLMGKEEILSVIKMIEDFFAGGLPWKTMK